MSDAAYYLKCIRRRLEMVSETCTDSLLEGSPAVSMLGLQALNDEIEWLDDYIAALQAAATEAEGRGDE